MNDEQGRYYRLSPKFWSDPMAMRWDDDTRLLAMYLLTCPHRTTEGLFRLPKLYAMADLGWSEERFTERLQQLVDDGFVEWDRQAEVVLIVKALTWQAPANPNQVKAAVKQLAMVPPTPLKARFKALAERYCERLYEGLPEGFGEGFLEGSGEPHAPSPAPPPETEPDGSGGKPPRTTTVPEFDEPLPVGPGWGDPLYLLLRTWAVEAGFDRPDDRAAAVQWQWLMQVVDEVLGDGKHSHGVRVSLCGEFVGHVTGEPPEREAWGHLHRLVSAHSGRLTLAALGKACDWGAGLRPQDRGDPLSLTKYAAAILQRWAEEAA